MPWLACTTGSPTLSSDRSLISASTSLACSWLAPPARAGRRREQLGLGDELERRASRSRALPGEAARPAAPTAIAKRSSPASKSASEATAGGSMPAVAQQLEQALAPALALGDDQHAVRRRCDVVLQRGAAARRAPRSTLRSGSGRAQASARVVAAAQRQLRMRVAAREELLGLEEQRLGRQERPLGVVLQEAVALARVGPEALAARRRGRRAAPASPPRRGSRRRSRSRRRTAAGSTRCRRWRCRCRCPCRCRAWSGRPRALAPAARNAARARLVHRELAAGQQAHLGHRVEAALGVGVEGADRVDLVVEQVDAVGHASSPSGTGRSGRRAPRTRRARRPG